MSRTPAWEYLPDSPRQRHLRQLTLAVGATLAILLVMAVILSG